MKRAIIRRIAEEVETNAIRVARLTTQYLVPWPKHRTCGKSLLDYIGEDIGPDTEDVQ